MPEPRIDIDPSGLVRALRAFTSDTDKPGSLTRPAAELFANVANVPRDTGALADSRQIVAAPGGTEVLWSKPYAGAVHKANPFAERAAAKVTTNAVELMRDGISKLLQTHGLR